MKSGWLDVEFGELLIGDFPPLFIGGGIQLGIDLEPCFGRRGADQVDHHLIRLQRLPLPIPGHVAEQPMLDLVPLAGPRWEMTDLDLQPGLIAQPLQLDFPQAAAAAVTAPAVGRDQQPRRAGGSPPPQARPPAPACLDRELRRVAADAHADPALVVPQVVGPARHRLALARVGEVVRIDLPRLALRPPGSPRGLEGPQRLLLRGIDRDRWLPPALLGADAAVDVPQLRPAAGLGVALPPLSLGFRLRTPLL